MRPSSFCKIKARIILESRPPDKPNLYPKSVFLCNELTTEEISFFAAIKERIYELSVEWKILVRSSHSSFNPIPSPTVLIVILEQGCKYTTPLTRVSFVIKLQAKPCVQERVKIDFLLGYVDTINTGFIVTDKCPYFKKLTISLELDFITENSIIYVLMAWVVIFISAKALKLERFGFEIKAYSLVYKNKGVNELLIKILGRTRSAVSIFANVSVIAGFIMMGFAFWFLLNNVSNFFVAQSEFNELTVLIPGVTLTSAPAITYFYFLSQLYLSCMKADMGL